MKRISPFFLILLCIVCSCTSQKKYDILIKNGQIVNGSGQPSYKGDIAINADTIVAIGNVQNAKGKLEIDASGLVVAPGFINMLSWANESLIEDGKSQSDIRQGVTLEVFGEGESWGPLSPALKKYLKDQQGDIAYNIEWTTLGEFLDFLVKKGVSPNVASFVGATTLRTNVIGFDNRTATKKDLDAMKLLANHAMEEGALGIGSSLMYVPACYSTTEELIELCKVASEYDGMYISHIRNQSDKLLQSLDELIRIAHEANIRAEVYHLKQTGKINWNKYAAVVAKIDSARLAGLAITANMYPYIAGATGLDASMPPWVQEGGLKKWIERLKDPTIRKKVLKEMIATTHDWENLMQASGSADKVMLIGFKNDSLKYLAGKTLNDIAKMRNQSPEETAIDLVIQDGSRIETIYFTMSEENVKKQIALPWISFGSDEFSAAPEGVFLKSSVHPRAYGTFARVLGNYVREEKVISLEDAIYKLTTLPATNLKIKKRGALKNGFYADIAIFNPTTIQDNATFENPQQYATGMVHVFVNGIQVLKNGKHTGELPGKVVRGPGWINKNFHLQ